MRYLQVCSLKKKKKIGSYLSNILQNKRPHVPLPYHISQSNSVKNLSIHLTETVSIAKTPTVFSISPVLKSQNGFNSFSAGNGILFRTLRNILS